MIDNGILELTELESGEIIALYKLGLHPINEFLEDVNKYTERNFGATYNINDVCAEYWREKNTKGSKYDVLLIPALRSHPKAFQVTVLYL